MSLSYGVELIAEALPYLSQEELSEKAALYVTTCLKICKKQALPEQAPAAYCVLAELLDRCRGLAEVDKIVTSQVVNDVFHAGLPRATAADHVGALHCLEILFSRYTKPCIGQRVAAEKYLVQFLDLRDAPTVVGASKCVHLLQQMRAPWERDGDPKHSWRNQLQRLRDSASLVMDQLFSHAGDIYRTGGYFQNLEKKPTADTSSSAGYPGPLQAMLKSICVVDPGVADGRHSVLANRLCNILVYIQSMLVEAFPVPKPIRPTLILSLLMRIVSVSSAASAPSSSELAQELVRLKMSALRTLDAIIVCLDMDLLPFSALVFRLCMQVLRWAQDNNIRGVNEVRRAAYDTLCLWFATIKCHQLTGRGDRPGLTLEEELVATLIADYTPETSRLQLTLTGGATANKHLSKKAKRRLVSAQANASSLSNYTPGLNKTGGHRWMEQELQLKLAALRCLESLLLTSGCFLKHSTHKKIQESLVSQCFEIQREGTTAGPQVLSYRLSLLRALEAARVGCAAGLAPPTQYCYVVFSAALRDSDAETSKFCSMALLAIRRFLHDAPPSLCAPQQPERKASPVASEGFSSRRNVDALTQLLGHERVSELSEEPITITDSPEPTPETTATVQMAVPNLHDAQTQLEPSSSEQAPNKDARFQSTDPKSIEQLPCIDLDSSENEMDIEELGRDDAVSDSETPELEIVERTSDGSNDNTLEFSAKEGEVLVEKEVPEAPLGQSGFLENFRKDGRQDTLEIVQSQESDEFPISCGQVLKHLQEQSEIEAAMAVEDVRESVEGISEKMEVALGEKVEVREGAQDANLSIEDMMADFVDEVVVDAAAKVISL